MTLLVSPEHVFTRHFVLKRNFVQQEAAQKPMTRQEVSLAAFHKQHRMVRPKQRPETYCLTRTRIVQVAHTTALELQSNNSAKLTQLSGENAQLNHQFAGGKL